MNDLIDMLNVLNLLEQNLQLQKVLIYAAVLKSDLTWKDVAPHNKNLAIEMHMKEHGYDIEMSTYNVESYIRITQG